MRPREGVDRLQHRVQDGRTFGSVQEERLLAVFDRLGVARFEDSRRARRAWFARGGRRDVRGVCTRMNV